MNPLLGELAAEALDMPSGAKGKSAKKDKGKEHLKFNFRYAPWKEVLDWFAEHPDERCVSVDPSDGGGWCECDACKRLGSISDRAFGLANEIAKVVAPILPVGHPDVLASAGAGAGAARSRLIDLYAKPHTS